MNREELIKNAHLPDIFKEELLSIINSDAVILGKGVISASNMETYITSTRSLVETAVENNWARYGTQFVSSNVTKEYLKEFYIDLFIEFHKELDNNTWEDVRETLKAER